ncbi:hypothetical protein scyTo_0006389 [Scyliorhinus torazame]|uniref:Uncharacterized protein n=1 Tax=Scyliorhinus torazame TaxID=75743 RepID=A0A401PHM6_SCYTO|nr:hypothetical protein [Scyliorhinus torazame]
MVQLTWNYERNRWKRESVASNALPNILTWHLVRRRDYEKMVLPALPPLQYFLFWPGDLGGCGSKLLHGHWQPNVA